MNPPAARASGEPGLQPQPGARLRPAGRRARRAWRPVRRIACYGFLGSGNLGNDASLETVLDWFRREHPEAELSCITLAPEVIRARYGIEARSLSWSRPGDGPARPLARLGRLAGRAVDLPRSLALAGSADAVIVPGMGVLEESLGVRPWGLPLWLYLLALACRLRRRPFVLLDVGAEPATNRLTRRLFVATAGLASHLSYRDEWSALSMRQAGGREPDLIAPDLAFAHPDPTPAAPRPGLIVVGVMAYHDGDHDGGPAFDRYLAALTEALPHLLDQGDRLVLLGGDGEDIAVAEQLAVRLRTARPGLDPAAVTVRDVTDFAGLCREMAPAEAVIATRFHNLVCALRLARPTVSVGYAEKNTRLMREVGLAEYCQHLQDVDAATLLAQLSTARARNEKITADLGQVTVEYAHAVRGLLRRMATQTLGFPDPR